MEPGKKSLIFKIIATAWAIIYGVTVAVLMLQGGGWADPKMLMIIIVILAISIGALVYVWWPRKND